MNLGERLSSKWFGASLIGGVVAAMAVGVIAFNLSGPADGGRASSRVDEPEVWLGAPQRMRLITKEQYINTLSHIFGPELRIDARFAPMTRKDGLLANGAADAGVTAAQLDQYRRAAGLVAASVVDGAHRDYLIPCKPSNEDAADPACAREFLSAVGRLLYRRPLTEGEVTKIVDEANNASEQLHGFYPGISVALEAMLLSPQFLFITDSYEESPGKKGKYRLDAYSLAQRLSFFLWDAGPDSSLLDAAESGEILTPRGLQRIVDSMVESPRLEEGLRTFFDDMMDFEAFENLAKDPQAYPNITGEAIADAREQTLRTIVNFLVEENGDYRDLFTTREAYMSSSLAPIYNIPLNGEGWTLEEFPEDSGRAGILTHVSFLTLHSHPGRSSPTLRGKALREIFLCQKVPPPPPNVDFSALENPRVDQKTQRDRVEFHLKDPVCAGCHKVTDPIGLTMELFDGAGNFRTTEHGATIDASGSLDGVNFSDTAGLANALRDHPALPRCLVRRMYSYGTGGAPAREYTPILDYFNRRFAEQGYSVPALMKTIALSEAFTGVTPANEGLAALIQE